MEIINKSRLPISITRISMEQNGKLLSFEQLPQEIVSGTRGNGEPYTAFSEPFPISLQGLDAKSGLFLAIPKNHDFAVAPHSAIKLHIATNRGKLQSKVEVSGFSDHLKLL
ncbi:hypothetical protein [Ligaoa zhengdingensis]|uniref:hypothetical protein n=1 Tax=Ligaoa zhengdingensis TaxID=2763658 RepID=UPI0031BA8297